MIQGCDSTPGTIAELLRSRQKKGNEDRKEERKTEKRKVRRLDGRFVGGDGYGTGEAVTS